MSPSQFKKKPEARPQTIAPSSGLASGESASEKSVFVSPEEFRELAISHRPLVRVDVTPPGVRGLFDRVTRVRYLVDERRLSQSYAG